MARLLLQDKNLVNYKFAEAHRCNLLAMSMYKYLRYGKQKQIKDGTYKRNIENLENLLDSQKS